MHYFAYWFLSIFSVKIAILGKRLLFTFLIFKKFWKKGFQTSGQQAHTDICRAGKPEQKNQWKQTQQPRAWQHKYRQDRSSHHSNPNYCGEFCQCHKKAVFQIVTVPFPGKYHKDTDILQNPKNQQKKDYVYSAQNQPHAPGHICQHKTDIQSQPCKTKQTNAPGRHQGLQAAFKGSQKLFRSETAFPVDMHLVKAFLHCSLGCANGYDRDGTYQKQNSNLCKFQQHSHKLKYS